MKILFVNGSLEEGKDGVGDYTRRLAGELIRQGHECRIIALMDRFLADPIKEMQVAELVKIQTLRLPFNRGHSFNSNEAKEWIDEFGPEWISVQYVPFSFHQKGLPLNLERTIKYLSKGRKLHLMFHELWVGMDAGSSFKFKLWGKLQKRIIAAFLRKLKPDLIHTNSRLYIDKLSDLGIKAFYLPLFGNIPVFNLQESTNNSHSEKLSFIIFGSIHPGAPVEAFVACLAAYAMQNEKKVEFYFMGRCGIHLHEWVKVCTHAGFRVNVLGELSNKSISEQLVNTYWGITTTPYLLVEKSGTVAAMLEHGLPIICVAREWSVNNYISNLPLFEIDIFKKNTFIDFLKLRTTRTPPNIVSEVSLLLTDSFSSN